MIKIAVIGAGAIGVEHIEAISKAEECRLCALCDVNEEAVKKAAAENNVPYFLDYRDIPSSVEVDAVIINLPHFLHCESSVFFLERGIHVFIEKPMANTTEECEKMLAAAKQNNVRLAVGHIQRFFEHNIKIKEIVESGRLGRFCMYTESRNGDYFSEDRPKWFLEKEKAGGGISMNYGAHALDKLFNLFGPQAVKVTGNLANYKNDATIEGHAQFLVAFHNGSSAAITFDAYCDIPGITEYFFTNGAIRLYDDGSFYSRMNGEWTEEGNAVVDIKAGMLYQLREFCKFIRGEQSLTPDGEYGKAVIAAIEQLYK